MRTLMRVVLPIAIVLVLVGGVSYFVQYTPPPAQVESKGDSGADAGLSLLVPERTGVWDADDPNYGREYEVGAHGYFDFWIANPNAVPTSIYLNSTSCTCQTVELGSVPPAAVAAVLRDEAALSCVRNLGGVPGFDPSMLPLVAILNKVEFAKLNMTETPRQIPAADAQLGVRLSVVRLHWIPKALGPMRLAADLIYYGPDNKAMTTHFEVPIVVVPSLIVAPPAVVLGDLKSGDTRPLELVFWTSTRDKVPLELPATDDPCIVIGKPRPMTPAECRKFTERMPTDQPYMPPSRLKCGYRVSVTVHERLGDNQLELGPFSRRLTFNPGGEYETQIVLSGAVKGDIRIEGKDEDRIQFGDFRCDSKAVKLATIVTKSSDMKLEVLSTTTGALQAAIRQRSPGVWELKLTVEAEALTGPLPTGTAVTLTTVGAQPRRIRIPVTGSAYVP